jgi:hypothetical protein
MARIGCPHRWVRRYALRRKPRQRPLPFSALDSSSCCRRARIASTASAPVSRSWAFRQSRVIGSLAKLESGCSWTSAGTRRGDTGLTRPRRSAALLVPDAATHSLPIGAAGKCLYWTSVPFMSPDGLGELKPATNDEPRPWPLSFLRREGLYWTCVPSCHPSGQKCRDEPAPGPLAPGPWGWAPSTEGLLRR